MHSIKRVVEEAELMAGVEIEHAHVGLAGSHIKGFNSCLEQIERTRVQRRFRGNVSYPNLWITAQKTVEILWKV